MLGAQGIITPQEADLVISGLGKILADVESGELTIGSEYEDIHSFVEANLIERIGNFIPAEAAMTRSRWT